MICVLVWPPVQTPDCLCVVWSKAFTLVFDGNDREMSSAPLSSIIFASQTQPVFVVLRLRDPERSVAPHLENKYPDKPSHLS